MKQIQTLLLFILLNSIILPGISPVLAREKKIGTISVARLNGHFTASIARADKVIKPGDRVYLKHEGNTIYLVIYRIQGDTVECQLLNEFVQFILPLVEKGKFAVYTDR